MISLALCLMALAVLLLVVAVCSEGASWLGYCLYSGRSSASVFQVVPFTLTESKGTVERQGPDGTFAALPNTQDRSVGHLPIYFQLFEKGKSQYILQWEAEGALWRGHYRYLKKEGFWRPSDTLELRYQQGKPWRYAVKDTALWRRFALEVVCCLALFALGLLLWRAAI